MKPHIICHMTSSIDGRIDGTSLKNVMPEDEYEATGSALQGDAWICGRTTMQQHFAAKELFVSKSNEAAGKRPVYVATRAESYAVSLDTDGKLRWDSADIDGEHLICIVSERAPEDYLSYLQSQGVSYIVTGETSIDLVEAVELLNQHFGIRNLLLEGGGRINGAFLEANLIDEVSLLLVPGIDGRHAVPTVFDWVRPTNQTAVPLKLKSVEKRKQDTLWLRYDVVRP